MDFILPLTFNYPSGCGLPRISSEHVLGIYVIEYRAVLGPTPGPTELNGVES